MSASIGRDFAWYAPENGTGLVWERKKNPSGTLEDHLVCAPEAEFRQYQPFAEPVALYREIVLVKPTPEGFLSFANRYGMLRVPDARPETLSDWKRLVADLSESVKVWDLLRVGNTGGLSDLFVWAGGMVHYRDPRNPNLEKRLAGYDLAKEREPVLEGDLEAAASLLIENYLAWPLGTANIPRLRWDPRKRRLVYFELPLDLQSAIHLQFAQAIRDHCEPRTCRVCGRWFDVAPGTSRSDRVTCSTACRSRSYRERQDRARQLREEGKSLKEIATKLDSDVGTVRGWVTGKKGK